MGQIYRRQTLIFQVLIWTLGVFLSQDAMTAPANSTAIPQEIQSIVEKAAKKKDFSAEIKQITKMKEKPIAPLIAIFQDGNRHWKERWFAGRALSKFQTDETKQVLIKGSKDTLSIIRSASVEALTAYDDADSNKAILDAMNDPSLIVRFSVVKSLAKTKDRNAVDALGKELFEQRNNYRGQPLFEGMREDIIIALGEIGSMKGIDPLMKVFQNDSNPKIQKLACNSLEKIVKTDDKKSRSDCPDFWLTWQKEQNLSAKNKK